VSVEGHEREIAAVRVPAGAWERLAGDEGARIAAEVKALGFRYVALDLAAGRGRAG
jgi:PP-loop superfamily ATP-utilizing enzyme